MNKKKQLSVFTLVIIGLFSLFSINISAQSKSANETTTGAIQKVLHHYISISSLPMNERPAFFSEKLSPDDRAVIFKFHLAFQFVKRPNLSNEQKNLILEAISIITPDTYDEKKPQRQNEAQQHGNIIEQKAKVLFSIQEGFEIFASLSSDQSDIDKLKKYVSLEYFSIQDRKEVVSNATNQEKSGLWKTHFAVFMATEKLNDLQMRFLSEMISLTKPDLFAIKAESSEWHEQDRKNQDLIGKMSLLFSREKGVEIFMILGYQTNNTSKINTLQPTNCDCCSTCWQCPWATNTCVTGNCRIKPKSCGFMWWYDCDGICTLDQ